MNDFESSLAVCELKNRIELLEKQLLRFGHTPWKIEGTDGVDGERDAAADGS